MIYILKVYLAIGIAISVLECTYAILFSDILFNMNRKQFLKHVISELDWEGVMGVIIAVVLWPILAAIVLFGDEEVTKNHDNQP